MKVCLLSGGKGGGLRCFGIDAMTLSDARVLSWLFLFCRGKTINFPLLVSWLTPQMKMENVVLEVGCPSITFCWFIKLNVSIYYSPLNHPYVVHLCSMCQMRTGQCDEFEAHDVFTSSARSLAVLACSTVHFMVCSPRHCVELFNWNSFFFLFFNVSGIKEYWGWWRWRWGGRGGWPDPASSSVCTKKSHSRVQAGLPRNIPGNKTPIWLNLD